MHETAIVGSLFEIIRAKVAEHKIQKVVRVKLKVGELTAVEPMTLTACFEVFAEGTVVEGAELLIEQVPLTGQCGDCSREFRIREFRFRCPECESTSVEIVGGKELYIEDMEVQKEQGGNPR
ncbi:hydrogenase-3 nickel incorporation protein HypA [Geothermobacter ehrlichii]|uniref:Hydrogenase maturation factor HypA n=1 Tax=Geothermobacter ehrlichii TaxID=213224 RepID=A0A5D3WMK2_9BACT|nr:hydrogenase maturation nickel metallochaperone HypA [Geothermobacter ehrlichii]TYO98568.1 hydrogenase-3 nickel incorporation protein HypA [Geothermobacter ehrlichii]